MTRLPACESSPSACEKSVSINKRPERVVFTGGREHRVVGQSGHDRPDREWRLSVWFHHGPIKRRRANDVLADPTTHIVDRLAEAATEQIRDILTLIRPRSSARQAPWRLGCKCVAPALIVGS